MSAISTFWLCSNLSCSVRIGSSAELRSDTVSTHRARAQSSPAWSLQALIHLNWPGGIPIWLTGRRFVSHVGVPASNLPLFSLFFAKSSCVRRVLCPSDPLFHCIAATAGMSDGSGDREKWSESFFGRALWALWGRWTLKMGMRTGSAQSWTS